MITSRLIEEYAIKGLCTWKTFNTGITSTFTIPVPAGSFILLRQIIVYPFVPHLDANPNKRSLNTIQLTLLEQGGTNELNYVIRMNNSKIGDNTDTGAPIFIETWQTFRNLCVIDIGTIPGAQNYSYAPGAQFEQQAQEKRSPLGYYGISLPPKVDTNDTPSKTIYPTGEKRKFIGATYAGGIIDRLRFNFNQFSAIPAVSATKQADNEFPLFTFGYWEFKNGIPIELF